jgi:peptidase C39-like protein
MTRSYRYLFISSFIFLLYNLLFPVISFASDPIENWSSTIPLPNLTASHTLQIYNGKLFLLAGANTQTIPNNLTSKINADGSISNWVNSLTPSPSVFWFSSILQENHVYLIGGENFPQINSLDTVYLGNIDMTGNINNWSLLTSLPQKSALGASVIFNNRIYFAGGIDNNTTHNQIYFAPINSDGTIGTWTLAGALPKALSGFGMITNGNNLIIIGGEDVNTQDQSGVYTAPINSNGTIGTWITTSILPQPVYRSSIVKVNNKVISIGGIDNGITLEEVYYADLNPDGTISDWQTSQNFLPQPICCEAAIASDNYIYLSGGYNSNAGYLNTVYYTKINIANDLSVPLIKQISNPWQSQEYDSAHIWNPSNITINAWGCALTSATMIFRYYGINELPDGTPIDPGSLNTWLKNQPDGYVRTGWVNWLALSRLSKLATNINHIIAFDALEYNRISGANTTQLTTDLDNQHPDILEESGHFIVAKGINDTTFDINDPYYSRSTLNDGYNNSFLSLGQYIPSHTDLSYIMITTSPNANITIKNNRNITVGTSFTQSSIINPLNSSNKNSPINFHGLTPRGISRVQA